MSVELEQPFVWPKAPTDFTPWDRERYLALTEEPANDEEKEEQRRAEGPLGVGPVYYADQPVETPMRTEAEKLLKGEVQWSTRKVQSQQAIQQAKMEETRRRRKERLLPFTTQLQSGETRTSST